MVILKLTQGECIKLYGPMSVTVKSGCLNVYYKKACAGDRFVVHKARNYVVEALDECELDVSMINNSQIQPIELEDPYWEKKKIISDIVKGDHRKIMVIGCIDCGKTALVTMLYNAFA
ncbi:MAG: GTPase, partial [Desulfurococcaceae archaeon]